MLALALTIVVAASSAQAQTVCSEALSAWVSQCGTSERIALSVLHCVPGRLIVRAGGETGTRIEITEARGAGPWRIGPVDLTPVGEFPDWAAAPRSTREAFGHVALCARRSAPPVTDLPHGIAGVVAAPSFVPWPFVGALVCVLALLLRALRERRTRAVVGKRTGVLGALVVATWAGRRMVVPFAYFHQNGHGPEWVRYALGEPSRYGPGFRQLFGACAQANAFEPDRAVFIAMSWLGATVPAAVWLMARSRGGQPVLAWVFGLLAASQPLLVRLAHSESYFSVSNSLLFLGAATLAAATAHPARSRVDLSLATVAAGLFAAQSALVHPTAWVPAAMLPFVVAIGPGRVRARLADAALVAMGMGAIGALVVVPTMRQVLRGYADSPELAPSPMATLQRIDVGFLAWLLVGFVAVIGIVRVRARLATAIGVAIVVSAIERVVNNLGSSPSFVPQYAWSLLFAPAVVAAIASAVGCLPRPVRSNVWAASVFAVLGFAHAARIRVPWTALPTDAREQRWITSWRASLPARARVTFLRVTGRQWFEVPVFAGAAARGVVASEGVPRDTAGPEPLFYYRSSLCSSSREAVAFCEEWEQSLHLERVRETTLSAHPSMTDLPYQFDSVRVGLYRIRTN